MGIFGIGTDIVKVSRIKKLIINKISWKPFIKLIDSSKKIVEKKLKKKKYKISLSLTDEKNYAVAFVTISIWQKIRLLI